MSPPRPTTPPPAATARRGWARRLPTVGPTAFRRLAVVSLVMVVLIVVTGAAVRLTGSGLGCADWPDCSTGHLTPPLQFHSLVEFGNRMVTVLLTIVVAVTFVAALRRRPFRRDLAWLSAGLIGGVLLEAVMGGIVVYTKLNPYLVMVHFLASLPLVVDAVVLLHRCSRDYAAGAGRRLVARPIVLLGRGLVVLLALVLAAGAATTGAGPHAGSAQGQLVAKRIPVPLRAMAELHSSLALLLVGVALSLAVALHAIDVPERVRRAARILVVTLVAQAAVGYTQYFTHLPAGLVEIHVIGATVLVVGVVQFLLALTHHPPEVVPAPATAPTSAQGTAPASAKGTTVRAPTAGAVPEPVAPPAEPVHTGKS
ncbi:MAG TPA: COX15/CtaA family protein [Acidimicrobiales bacterium]|nr:COX15/CtaA family protein [Acidimicrobiales bacterium]